jgi:hypothetical protein
MTLRAKILNFRVAMAADDLTLRENAVLSHKKAEFKAAGAGLAFAPEKADGRSTMHRKAVPHFQAGRLSRNGHGM